MHAGASHINTAVDASSTIRVESQRGTPPPGAEQHMALQVLRQTTRRFEGKLPSLWTNLSQVFQGQPLRQRLQVRRQATTGVRVSE